MPGADRPEYLEELRLQSLESLDRDALVRAAEAAGKHRYLAVATRQAEVADT